MNSNQIREFRQSEKWMKFVYPEDQCAQYDPYEGDLRGSYKEIDKMRKKTWYSKGSIPLVHYRQNYDSYYYSRNSKKRRIESKNYIRGILTGSIS
jgi:hypothetical protein